MKLIELVQKINDEKLEELPLEIRYKGKIYTRKGASCTYYEKGEMKSHTLEIDTFDLDMDVETFSEDKEDVYDLCDKIRNILDEIEDLEDL